MIAARRLHVCFPEKSYAVDFLTFSGRSDAPSSTATRFFEPLPRTAAKSAGGGGRRRVTLGNLLDSVPLATSRALPLPFPCSRGIVEDDDEEDAGGGCDGTEGETG